MAGKVQIIDRLVSRGAARAQAAAAVDAVLDEITAVLAAGERVTFVGFGTFEPAARAARQARNPRTGTVVEVPSTTVARFRPGTTLRTAVATGTAGSATDLSVLGAASAAAPAAAPAARVAAVRTGAARSAHAPVPASAASTGAETETETETETAGTQPAAPVAPKGRKPAGKNVKPEAAPAKGRAATPAAAQGKSTKVDDTTDTPKGAKAKDAKAKDAKAKDAKVKAAKVKPKDAKGKGKGKTHKK